jgi:hypothetical protein
MANDQSIPSGKQIDLLKTWLDGEGHAGRVSPDSPSTNNSFLPFIAKFQVVRNTQASTLELAFRWYQSLVQADRTPSRVDSVPGPNQSVAVLAIDPTSTWISWLAPAKFIWRVGMTGQLVSTIVGEVSPGTEVQTDQQRAETAHFNVHPLGSAPMLSREDDGAVDASLSSTERRL